MQLDFKENVQNMTNGKVYVKLATSGQLRAGCALVQKVQQGTIQAAQHSLSNFAPFAPAVDLINLPYFCGKNQKFINLVTSKAWIDNVHPKVAEKGFKPLWYIVIDPRVVALRKGKRGPVKTPNDLKGIKFRVPGSKMLQQYYRSIGANPTPVAWGETPSATKQGVADALDPSIGAPSLRTFLFFYMGEEVARYSFIYFVWIGLAMAVRDRSSIRVDVVLKWLPNRGKIMLYILGDFVMLGVAIIALIFSIETFLTSIKFGSVTHRLRISNAWFLFAVPFGFSLICFRLLQSIRNDFRSLINNGKVFEGKKLFD